MGMVDGAITDGKPSEMFTACVLLGCRLLSWTCLSRAWRCWQTLSHVQRRVHVHNFVGNVQSDTSGQWKCPSKVYHNSQFWKESVGAFSAHRQAHVNTSRVVDRVTVWEIFLLIFSQDLNLFFVPVCVNEAQCCVSNKKFLCAFCHLNTSLQRASQKAQLICQGSTASGRRVGWRWGSSFEPVMEL